MSAADATPATPELAARASAGKARKRRCDRGMTDPRPSERGPDSLSAGKSRNGGALRGFAGLLETWPGPGEAQRRCQGSATLQANEEIRRPRAEEGHRRPARDPRGHDGSLSEDLEEAQDAEVHESDGDREPEGERGRRRS